MIVETLLGASYNEIIDDYSTHAKNYLLSIGMSESAITQLIQNLSAIAS